MRLQFLSGLALALAGALTVSCGSGGYSGGGTTPSAPSSSGTRERDGGDQLGLQLEVVQSESGAGERRPDGGVQEHRHGHPHHLVFDNGSVDIGDIAPGATSRARHGAGGQRQLPLHEPSDDGRIDQRAGADAATLRPSYGYC